MIFNLRGTHGSGKSTVMRKLIDAYGNGRNFFPKSLCKKYDQTLKIPGIARQFVIIGSYDIACGGADSVQPYADVLRRLKWYSKDFHLIFEGALISSCHGEIVEWLEDNKDFATVGFLDTPFMTCVDRIRARRLERGNFKPLKTENTQKKFEFCLRSQLELRGRGLHCVTIRHQHAFTDVLRVLKG